MEAQEHKARPPTIRPRVLPAGIACGAATRLRRGRSPGKSVFYPFIPFFIPLSRFLSLYFSKKDPFFGPVADVSRRGRAFLRLDFFIPFLFLYSKRHKET